LLPGNIGGRPCLRVSNTIEHETPPQCPSANCHEDGDAAKPYINMLFGLIVPVAGSVVCLPCCKAALVVQLSCLPVTEGTWSQCYSVHAVASVMLLHPTSATHSAPAALLSCQHVTPLLSSQSAMRCLFHCCPHSTSAAPPATALLHSSPAEQNVTTRHQR
jgi:hypothetical protein